MSDEKIQPFDSFIEIYKVLIWAGFYKLLKKPKNRFKWICHQMYRPVAFLIAVINNVTRIIFLIQRRHNMEDVFYCSVLESPQFNLFIKVVALYLHSSRIDKINDLLHDPIFAANTKKDEELLCETKRTMDRVVRFMKLSVAVASTVWFISLMMMRYQDPSAVVYAYVPFNTDTWTGHTLSVIIEVVPTFWTGYGHLSIDCLVVAYYAQAEVQLKIIKYNLEHLFDADGSTAAYDGGYRPYKDVADIHLRNRFVHYVQRYETVVWYTNEVSNIFNTSLTIQMICSTSTLCVVTYIMSLTPVASVQFAFLTLLLSILLLQVLLYCYFGNLVQYESDSVITSVYKSDWLSASPQFRRLILVAMLRWSRPIVPRVSRILPLSLQTYLSILRSAYSLYAVLITSQKTI